MRFSLLMLLYQKKKNLWLSVTIYKSQQTWIQSLSNLHAPQIIGSRYVIFLNDGLYSTHLLLNHRPFWKWTTNIFYKNQQHFEEILIFWMRSYFLNAFSLKVFFCLFFFMKHSYLLTVEIPPGVNNSLWFLELNNITF